MGPLRFGPHITYLTFTSLVIKIISIALIIWLFSIFSMPLIKQKFELSFSLNNWIAIYLSCSWSYNVEVLNTFFSDCSRFKYSTYINVMRLKFNIFLYHLWMKIFFYIICGWKYISLSFVDENMECNFVLRWQND